MKQLKDIDRDHQLWVLLADVRHLIYLNREKELRKYGMTPDRAGILNIIMEKESNLSPAQLARYTLVTPQSLSSVLNGMKREGLIEKIQNPTRANMLRIVITPKGKRAYYGSRKRKSIHHALSSLTEDEKGLLRSCLAKIFQHLTGQSVGMTYP